MEKIKRYITDHKDELLDLICQIIQISSPTGREMKKARFVLAYLQDLGYTDAYIDDAGNVLCPVQTSEGQKLSLYNAHIDTVFPSGTDLTPHINESTLSAPSCGDNSANAAGLLFFLKMVKDLGLTLPHGALFAFDVGEEGLGNLKGMRYLMNRWKDSIADCLAVDCTYDTIVSIPVGSLRLCVTVDTEGGHSWMHFGKTNAIAVAASIISSLYSLSVPSDPKTTYNIGTIEGGTTINTIASHAAFTVDLRSISRDALRALQRQVERILECHATPDVRIETTLLGERPCSDGTSVDALMARLRPIRQRYGLPSPQTSGSTDANIPLSLGIPAISWGIVRSSGEHSLQEKMDLDTIVPGMCMLAEYILL